MNRIIIASNNEGKVREIKDLFKDTDYHLLSMREVGLYIDIPEDGSSYKENALIKAREIKRVTSGIVISDDSGLEVDYLGGRPGIHSARYASTTDERIQKLLTELEGVPLELRGARFVCISCLFIDNNRYFFFEGEVRGLITLEPRGDQGFGFDPVFYLPEYKKTMAELPVEIKNRVSHRARAFAALKEFLLKLTHNRD